jgi:Spy/CpxP family protein refolding chaperone
VREIFAAATLDQSRLRELLLRQSELRADQLVAQHAMRAKVKQTLTVEQQARWEGVRRQRMEHRGGQAAPGQTSELERGATNK